MTRGTGTGGSISDKRKCFDRCHTASESTYRRLDGWLRREHAESRVGVGASVVASDGEVITKAVSRLDLRAKASSRAYSLGRESAFALPLPPLGRRHCAVAAHLRPA